MNQGSKVYLTQIDMGEKQRGQYIQRNAININLKNEGSQKSISSLSPSKKILKTIQNNTEYNSGINETKYIKDKNDKKGKTLSQLNPGRDFINTTTSVISQARYLNRNKENFNQTKEYFLNFLINQSTKYADLNKIEDHYRESIVDNIEKININKNHLDEKKARLNYLTYEIDDLLKDNYIVIKETHKRKYENKINNLNLEIDKQALTKEMYTINKQNLENDNYKIRSKLEKLNAINQINTQHFESYKIIHDKALNTIKNKLSMIDKLADFNNLTQIKANFEIQGKKKEFKDLENKITEIKQETIDVQTELDNVKKDIESATAAVKEQNRRNFHMNNNNFGIW